MTVEVLVGVLGGAVVVLATGRLIWLRRRRAEARAIRSAQFEQRLSERLAAIGVQRDQEPFATTLRQPAPSMVAPTSRVEPVPSTSSDHAAASQPGVAAAASASGTWRFETVPSISATAGASPLTRTPAPTAYRPVPPVPVTPVPSPSTGIAVPAVVWHEATEQLIPTGTPAVHDHSGVRAEPTLAAAPVILPGEPLTAAELSVPTAIGSADTVSTRPELDSSPPPRRTELQAGARPIWRAAAAEPTPAGTSPRRRLWRDTSIVLLAGGLAVAILSVQPFSAPPSGAVLDSTGRPGPAAAPASQPAVIVATSPSSSQRPSGATPKPVKPRYAQPRPATDPCAALPGCATYVVQAGDRLGRIARRFNTTIEAILRVNPAIGDPNVIRSGDVLRIPRAK